MKIGDLGRFKETSSHILGFHIGRIFFINKALEDEGFEIILLDSGERWCLTVYELLYYTEILQTDKKCP